MAGFRGWKPPASRRRSGEWRWHIDRLHDRGRCRRHQWRLAAPGGRWRCDGLCDTGVAGRRLWPFHFQHDDGGLELYARQRPRHHPGAAGWRAGDGYPGRHDGGWCLQPVDHDHHPRCERYRDDQHAGPRDRDRGDGNHHQRRSADPGPGQRRGRFPDTGRPGRYLWRFHLRYHDRRLDLRDRQCPASDARLEHGPGGDGYAGGLIPRWHCDPDGDGVYPRRWRRGADHRHGLRRDH